jgi:alanine racemase
VRARVDLGAVRANLERLAAVVAPAEMLAVVKADAYGHGAVPVARTALDAGATALGVALVGEGVALRGAGLDATLLVLSEPPAAAAGTVVAHRLTPVVYTRGGIDALAHAAHEAGTRLPVHLKVDTGMHRVGCRPGEAIALTEVIGAHDSLELAGTCTHFAVADEPDDPYTREQIACFDAVLADLRRAGTDPGIVHAANSAGALVFPQARYDMVRLGIAMYGVPPAPGLASAVELRPALSVQARVAFVKDVAAGTRVSYGLRYQASRATRLATVPVGYADGVPRVLGERGGEVLVRGRRCPIAGTVTMDQIVVDVGDLPVEPGDEVVLLGRQGAEEITATEWAVRAGTIAYEIVCGIGPRVPRTYDEHDTEGRR